MERYQDYVIKDGKFVGKFEEMYQKFEDPWHQMQLEANVLGGNILASLIREYKLYNVVEVGCGLGKITNLISKECADTIITGVDVSQTAINKAQSMYPGIKFAVANVKDIDKEWEKYDGIIFSDIMWYILQDLEIVIKRLKENCGGKILMIKQVFYKGQQKYGNEYFTSQNEMINYLDCFELIGKMTCDLKKNDSISTITVFQI